MTLREAQKLNDFEVFVSMMKFYIAIVIFQRPFLYQKFSVEYGLISDAITVAMICLSNSNLVKALEFMPEKLTQPEQRLTYGKVVKYVLDERDNRMGTPKSSKFFKVLLDT